MPKTPQGKPQEAQRLYAKENPPAQDAEYAGTKVTSPDNPLGVSATQEDTPSSAVNPANPTSLDTGAKLPPLQELSASFQWAISTQGDGG